MTRFLLIFALLVPGLRPGLPCDHAQDRTEALAYASCVECCSADGCQVTECSHPQPIPQTPATPPRSGDVAPPLLPTVGYVVDEVPVFLTRAMLPGLDAHRLGHEHRRFESVVCRWLT